MKSQAVNLALASALIIAGLVISAEQIAGYFGGADGVTEGGSTAGAQLFRFGLFVIGGYWLLLRFLPQPNVPAAPDLHRVNSWEKIALAVLLFAGLWLRVIRLDNGIWFDEMLTYVYYMPLSVAEIFGTFQDPNNHLLYSILARVSLGVFGDSVWAFRLPAVGFGVGSIAAIYYFSRRVTTPVVSLFAAALLTFSYHHIWFSQNARGYTALLFFTLLSSSFLLDALRDNSRKRWIVYAVTAFFGAFAHLTMGFVVIAHFVIYLFSYFKPSSSGGLMRWNGFLFGFIPLGLLTTQAYALLLPDMFGGTLLATGLQGNSIAWTNPVWALLEVVNALQVGFSKGGVALIAVVVLAIGLIDLMRNRIEMIGLFVIPVGLGLFLVTSIGYTIFPRFFFFGMGFGVVVVMHGASITGGILGKIVGLSGGRSRWISVFICASIVVASLPSLRWVYLPKQNYAAAIELVEREKSAGDTVVTVGIADFPFNEYYGKRWKNIKTLKDLDEIQPVTSRKWLIYTMPVHAQSVYPDIIERINQNYDLVKRFRGSLNGGDVVVSLEKATDPGGDSAPGASN